MTDAFEIARGVSISAEALLGRRILAQGASGSGKSTALRLIFERSPSTFQQIILDTEDEFHTLRSAARPYLILGGSYPDAPGLERMPPVALAQAILRAGANAILQINELDLPAQRAFIGDFVSGLLSAPRDLWRPLLLGLDETDLYAPNGPIVESTNPLISYAKKGRKRGFGALFATQRLSALSADVRAQCESLLIGRVNQSLDRRAAAEMLGFSPSSQQARELGALRAGDFWLTGQAFSINEPRMVKLARPETVAPSPGMDAPPALGHADLEKIVRQLPTQAEDAPHVEARGTVRLVRVADEAALAHARAEGFTQGLAKGRESAAEQVRAALEQLARDFTLAEDVSLPVRRVAERSEHAKIVRQSAPVTAPHGALSRGAEALWQSFVRAYPRPISFAAAAKLAGRSVRSSAYPRSVQELMDCPLLESVDADLWKVAPHIACDMALSDSPAVPAEALAFWMRRLSASQAAMLAVLRDASGAVALADVLARANLSPKSSAVRRNVRELVRLGLAVESGDLLRLHSDFRS